jgi:hypothetical protein
MVTRIHISSEGEKPNETVKRQIGKYNWGLYCTKCDEFFAVAVADKLPSEPIEFISDGEPLFECPFCHHQQRRQVSEIAQLLLTEAAKRRPPVPPDAH